MRKRREWRAEDDAILSKLWAEKKDDKTIGYIMDRPHGVIFRHRHLLGLAKVGKPGGLGGWKHTPEARAKVSAANRRRWNNPEYRARHRDLSKAQAASMQNRYRRPPKGTPEFKLYRKICETLGPERARQEFA